MDAGWYPDAQDPSTQRYWDGSSWTDHTTGAASSGAAISSTPTWWEGDQTVRNDAFGAVEPGGFAPPAPAPVSANPFASFDAPAAPAPAVIPPAGPPPGWLADPQVPLAELG